MMYTIRRELGDHWAVVDKDGNFVSFVHDIIYYNRLTEFEARTIVEILNSGCDVNWDAISADWRWQVALQIGQ